MAKMYYGKRGNASISLATQPTKAFERGQHGAAHFRASDEACAGPGDVARARARIERIAHRRFEQRLPFD
jgi:hypothetical protein